MRKIDRCEIVISDGYTGKDRCTAAELYERIAVAIWDAAAEDDPVGTAMVKPA